MIQFQNSDAKNSLPRPKPKKISSPWPSLPAGDVGNAQQELSLWAFHVAFENGRSLTERTLEAAEAWSIPGTPFKGEGNGELGNGWKTWVIFGTPKRVFKFSFL